MNSFGRIFRISIFGESHAQDLGILIDACPAGIPLKEEDFLPAIAKRAPGVHGTTSRIESDIPRIKSGVYNSFTTGAPILISFENKFQNPEDYKFSGFFRPGHADFTAYKKYKGFNNPLGGGHFSGRLTLALVAAGLVAKKILKGIVFESEVLSVGGSKDIKATIDKVVEEKDSVGGIVECRLSNLPIGLGQPFFDSAESLISHLIFSIPGVKAIEFGNGFDAPNMRGSKYNDIYISDQGETLTNNCGGINGGITNGNQLTVKVYFRPSSSIGKTQNTYNFESKSMQDFLIQGRHDACFAIRTPIVVESALAIVMADLFLISEIYD